MDNSLRMDAPSLERDARVFASWSGELDAIRAALPAELTVSDFSDLPGARAVRSSFSDLLSTLESYITQGSREFASVARSLSETARDYASTEESAEQEIRRLAREVNDL
ncbi:MAG: hypothetical protein ACOH1T_07205 [Microbacteriaceae bacterium]